MLRSKGKVSVEIDYRGSATLLYFRRSMRWLAIVPLLFMLAIAVVGGIVATAIAAAVFADNLAFVVLFMAVWALAGLIIIGVSIFHAFGREYLIAHANELVHVYRLFWVDWPRPFAAEKIKSLKFVADNPRRTVKVNGTKIPQSALCVHLSTGKAYIGTGISRTEADRAIAAIQERIYVRRPRDSDVAEPA